MTHTKDKEMINTNKAVSVFFGANKNTGTANIYIPFPVKEIHVRGVDIDWQAEYCAVIFTSSLVNDGPLGGGFAGALYDNSTSTKKMRYIFNQPKDINGTYSFTYTPIDSINATSGSIGYAVFTLEFVGYV